MNSHDPKRSLGRLLNCAAPLKVEANEFYWLEIIAVVPSNLVMWMVNGSL